MCDEIVTGGAGVRPSISSVSQFKDITAKVAASIPGAKLHQVRDTFAKSFGYHNAAALQAAIEGYRPPSDPKECPSCGVDHIGAGSMRDGGDRAFRAGWCEQCGTEWEEHFAFTHIELVDDHQEEN